MELQALGVPMAPVELRVPQGYLEASASRVPWARRVNQEKLEILDSQDPLAFLGPGEKLVRRGTLVPLGLLAPQGRKAPLERMEQKGTWAPRGSLEILAPLEILELQV